MSVTRIATRYAKSLIDLAVEQNKLELIKDNVASFHEATKQRDFYLLVKSPVVKPSKKQEIFTAIFGDKYDELTNAFLSILIRKSREGYLPEIAREFLNLYKSIKKISSVTVRTASPLSDAALAGIKKKLEAANVTQENIEIETEVDPNLIGGFVLEVGDKLYDASVQHQLHELHKSLDN